MAFTAWSILADRKTPSQEAVFGRFVAYGTTEWADRNGISVGVTHSFRADATGSPYTEASHGTRHGQQVIEAKELHALLAELNA